MRGDLDPHCTLNTAFSGIHAGSSSSSCVFTQLYTVHPPVHACACSHTRKLEDSLRCHSSGCLPSPSPNLDRVSYWPGTTWLDVGQCLQGPACLCLPNTGILSVCGHNHQALTSFPAFPAMIFPSVYVASTCPFMKPPQFTFLGSHGFSQLTWKGRLGHGI